MSLNENVDKELEQEAQYLTTESPAEDKPDLTVVTDAKIDATLPEDIDQTTEQLNNYDVTIKTMENDVEKLHSLRDIAETVLAQETISQQDAIEIQEEYPDLYTDVADVKEYTQDPSSINLKATQDYVQEKVEAKFEEVKRSVLNFAQNNIENFEKTANELKDELIPSVLRELQTMREEANDVIEDTIDIKQFLVYAKGFREEDTPEIYNLTTIPLEPYDWREKYLIKEDFEFVVTEDTLKTFCDASGSEVMQFLLNKASLLSDTPPPPKVMSLKDLLQVYSSGILERYLQANLEDLDAKLKEGLVEKVRSQIQAEHTDASLETLAKDIRQLYETVDNLRTGCHAVRTFIQASSELMECFDD